MHMLKVENIHKTYGKTKVLAGVSFTMEKGETKWTDLNGLTQLKG